MRQFIEGFSPAFKEQIAALVRDEMLMDKETNAEIVWKAYNASLRDDFILGQMMQYMKATTKLSRDSTLDIIERYLSNVAFSGHPGNS